MKVITQVRSITEVEARRILAPYLEPLALAIERAWERWWELPGKDRTAAGTRTRASFVFDLIWQEIRANFEGMPGVSIENTRYSMPYLNVEGLLVVRFKKLDRDKLGSNIATTFQTEFTLQLQLPGLPPEAARLVVGYQLDKAQSKITNILVTYRIGNVVEWFFSAREGHAASPAVPVVLPFPMAPVASPKSRIGPKKPRKAAEEIEQATEDARETGD